jgi:methylase of polypeptide subunit release factors
VQVPLARPALVALGAALRAAGYRFTPPTPETHRRVNARPAARDGRSLVDVFGWSRPFGPGVLDPSLERLLREADALEPAARGWKSRVRYATLEALPNDLFVHSAWPTDNADAVFFGPDTHRFVSWLRRVVPERVGRLVDVGCGSGAGGLAVRDRAASVVLADVSPVAVSYAVANAALAGAEAEGVRSDVLAGVPGPIDAVISNPPYLVDAGKRLYRDGGERGIGLAVRIATEALERLAPGGTLALYCGTPVVRGRHLLRDRLAEHLVHVDTTWEELDPDVFGEELDRPAYSDVDRLAVLGLVARKGA